MPAQTLSASSSADVYPRTFFNRFFPQTALDLVTRIPGFALDRGSSVRGFGGGAGNVLIDGDRPTLKAGGLEEFLSRIPADTIDRIELSRGGQQAGETAGQSVIANIIRKPVTLSGAWSVELERSEDGRVYPRGELSIVSDVAGWETTTQVNGFWERFPFKDGSRAQFDPAGNLIRFQAEASPSKLNQAFLSSEAKRTAGGGMLTLNGRFGWSGFYRDTDRVGYDGRPQDGGQADDRLIIDFSSEYFEGELGADWTRTVMDDWSLKLLGLASFQDQALETISRVEAPVGLLQSTSLFEGDRQPIELLARATLSNVNGSLRPEFGWEGAFNRLDSALRLSLDEGNGVTVIELPASDVLIEELRSEAFANLVWVTAPRWTIELGLAGEVSDIQVSGDAENSQSFFFVKPSAAVNFNVSDRLQFRLGLRRMIGQLNFSDFAASTEAEDDRLIGGNPQLGPGQTTRLELTSDFRAGSGLAFNLELFHEWREDVLEQIVLPSGAFGVANAGSARVWGVDADASLPLGFLIKGGLVEADISWRDAAFDDPLTGMDRVVTGLSDINIDVDFRQDLPDLKLAWGIRYEPPTDTQDFFANEESTYRRGTRWTVFAETTRFFGVKSQIELRNIGGQEFPRERLFFAPDRSGQFSGSEQLDRTRGMFAKLTISDQF